LSSKYASPVGLHYIFDPFLRPLILCTLQYIKVLKISSGGISIAN
jgi:hypothetical protein